MSAQFSDGPEPDEVSAQANVWEGAPAWTFELVSAIEKHNDKLDALNALAAEAIAKAEPYLPEVTAFIEKLQKSPIMRVIGGL